MQTVVKVTNKVYSDERGIAQYNFFVLLRTVFCSLAIDQIVCWFDFHDQTISNIWIYSHEHGNCTGELSTICNEGSRCGETRIVYRKCIQKKYMSFFTDPFFNKHTHIIQIHNETSYFQRTLRYIQQRVSMCHWSWQKNSNIF